MIQWMLLACAFVLAGCVQGLGDDEHRTYGDWIQGTYVDLVVYNVTKTDDGHGAHWRNWTVGVVWHNGTQEMGDIVFQGPNGGGAGLQWENHPNGTHTMLASGTFDEDYQDEVTAEVSIVKERLSDTGRVVEPVDEGLYVWRTPGS